MMVIFLLFFPWYMNAMNDADNNDLNFTEDDFRRWVATLEGRAEQQPVQPTIATNATPVPPSTIIRIPAEAIRIAQRTQESQATSSTTDSDPYRSMRRQAGRTPLPRSQTRWAIPESHSPGQFMMRCFYQGCPWGFIYNWPVDEEELRYLQLMCTERIWQHCHSIHWSLRPINEFVISQLQRPTPAPQQNT